MLAQFVQLKYPWRNEAATDAQISLLTSKGVKIRPGLTKGEASDQIDSVIHGITDGQKRRLLFFGISSSGISKEEASERINTYLREHPDAEERYQNWKSEALRNDPPDCISREEWVAELDTIEKESFEGMLKLPPRNPMDEPASEKQLQYIRSLVREIDEGKLRDLTKTQSRVLIDEILKHKRDVSRAVAGRLMSKYAATANTSTLRNNVALPIIVGIVIGLIAFAILFST